jgi:hypothetical protein
MIVIIITIGIMYFVFSNISKTFSTDSIWLLFVFLSIIFISIIYFFTTIFIDIFTTSYHKFSLIPSISSSALAYSKNMKLQIEYNSFYFCLLTFSLRMRIISSHLFLHHSPIKPRFHLTYITHLQSKQEDLHL